MLLSSLERGAGLYRMFSGTPLTWWSGSSFVKSLQRIHSTISAWTWKLSLLICTTLLPDGRSVPFVHEWHGQRSTLGPTLVLSGRRSLKNGAPGLVISIFPLFLAFHSFQLCGEGVEEGSYCSSWMFVIDCCIFIGISLIFSWFVDDYSWNLNGLNSDGFMRSPRHVTRPPSFVNGVLNGVGERDMSATMFRGILPGGVGARCHERPWNVGILECAVGGMRFNMSKGDTYFGIQATMSVEPLTVWTGREKGAIPFVAWRCRRWVLRFAWFGNYMGSS
jgi:hypothetical protein